MKKLFFILLIYFSLNAVSQPVTDGLVSYWPLNGNAIDASGKNLNGDIYGAVPTIDRNGNALGAYKFNGADNVIIIPNSKEEYAFVQKTGVFTVSLFARIDDLTKRSYLIGNGVSSSQNGFFLLYENIQGSGLNQLKAGFFYGVNGTYDYVLGNRFTINDNNWHHIVLLGDGTNLTIYVDGLQDGDRNTINQFSDLNSNDNIQIGGYQYSSGTFNSVTNGDIDEILIYNRALSNNEIKVLGNSDGLIPISSIWKNSGTDIFYNTGNVGIGTTILPAGYKLAVAGKILAEEIQVSASGTSPWPDFVFASDYQLKTLKEVECFIKENQHLPDVPSAKEIAEKGISLGEMNALLLQKIEELTLYVIVQQREIEALKVEKSELESESQASKNMEIRIQKLEETINQINK